MDSNVRVGLILIVIVWMSGYFTGSCRAAWSWEKEAIQYKAGSYDQDTGKFYWIDNKER